jgi:hypothetical protein
VRAAGILNEVVWGAVDDVAVDKGSDVCGEIARADVNGWWSCWTRDLKWRGILERYEWWECNQEKTDWSGWVRKILAVDAKIWKVQEERRGDCEKKRTEVQDLVLESVVWNGEKRATRWKWKDQQHVRTPDGKEKRLSSWKKDVTHLEVDGKMNIERVVDEEKSISGNDTDSLWLDLEAFLSIFHTSLYDVEGS